MWQLEHLETVIAFGIVELSSLTGPDPPKYRVSFFLVERRAAGNQVVHKRPAQNGENDGM